MTNLAVLGCTGSIGTNTLEVVRKNRDRFQVQTLAAGGNTDLLARQIIEFQARHFVRVLLSEESTYHSFEAEKAFAENSGR